MAILRLESPTN